MVRFLDREMSVTPNPEYIKEIKDIVGKAPFFNHMAMRLVAMDIGKATIQLDHSNDHLQPFGLVHGGVIATIIDTATFWSVFMCIPEDAGLVNVDLKLNYLKSVTRGRLKAEGCAIRQGRRICYSEAKVYSENEDLIAHGTSTLMILSGKGIETKSKKFI
jgi:uncharacterized protein (TIGR00369 family)